MNMISKDIFYHLGQHEFSRFKTIVDDLINVHGVDKIVNVYGYYNASPLKYCLTYTPPLLDRFRYLVEKGAILDLQDPRYKPLDKVHPITHRETLMDIWARSATNTKDHNESLQMLMDYGVDPNNPFGSCFPLFGAINDTQRICLFSHGADIQKVYEAIKENWELKDTLEDIERAHKLYIASTASNLNVSSEPKKREPKL